MKKIKSLFKRSYEGNRQVYNEVVEGSEWVLNGEGVATRKWDGTCCLIKSGIMYKRYDLKKGRNRPEGFIEAQEPDPITGHHPGWLKVTDSPDDKWHREGYLTTTYIDGTYELIGPKVNGNREKIDKHVLIKHGIETLEDCPIDFDTLKEYLTGRDIEGVVWNHPDGRMVKIKGSDFGIKR